MAVAGLAQGGGVLLLILAAAGTPLLAACGTGPDRSPGKPAMSSEPARSPAAIEALPSDGKATFDQMFIDMMVPHHEGAVAMAKIAKERADHPEIKAMAAGVISSQEAEIGEMKGWRKAWFGSEAIPAMRMAVKQADVDGMDRMPGMSSMQDMAGDIERLKTAVPFDLAFLDAMVPHHEGAVAMAEQSASQAQHAEIKALALKIMDVQRKEIAQMKGWRALWYPSAPAFPQVSSSVPIRRPFPRTLVSVWRHRRSRRRGRARPFLVAVVSPRRRIASVA